MSCSPKICITGMGCISPVGNSVATSMEGLKAGLLPQAIPSVFSTCNLQDVDNCCSMPVCAVKDEWLANYKREWRLDSCADTLTLAHKATDEAIAQAGLQPQNFEQAGICVGTTVGSAMYFCDEYDLLRKELGLGKEKSAVDFGRSTETIKQMGNIHAYFEQNIAMSLAQAHKISGPMLTIANACTSGTDAIGIACQWLELGLCDVVLAGGADALSFVPYTGFQRLMIYSDSPCKPFDVNRSGLNLGEAAAMLVLEREADAKKRGAKILGSVAGYSAACDAWHITAPHPEGQGLKSAIKAALEKANLTSEDLAFINAHGTSTPENDKIESSVVSSCLADVPLWASKGNTGHCLGAAGALEAIFSLEALRSGEIPPSVGCDEPIESVKNSLVRKLSACRSNKAISLSMGFGGGCAAVVLEAGE